MIGVLQPFIPHYREDFFKGLDNEVGCEVYCYENREKTIRANYNHADIHSYQIASIEKRGFLFYNPFTLLKRKYSTLVLMLHVGHITSWLLLLTRFIHRKKIIVWGQGISVKRYHTEEKKLPLLMRWMVRLSDGAWFYTGKEEALWKRTYPSIRSIGLNNTISEVDRIVAQPSADKTLLRGRYGITQQTVFVFCARFNTEDRRPDLLLKAIEQLDSSRFGFIIIGGGKVRPDFSKYKHVYDFGEVYDREIKNDLFQMADIYFQPAWIGLSVVEAMAYGKPVFSFYRSEKILQGVEYGYIQSENNGLLFENMDQFLEKMNVISEHEIQKLSDNARRFARTKLSMENMVRAGVTLIGKVQ